jgi:hypothetical protein
VNTTVLNIKYTVYIVHKERRGETVLQWLDEATRAVSASVLLVERRGEESKTYFLTGVRGQKFKQVFAALHRSALLREVF